MYFVCFSPYLKHPSRYVSTLCETSQTPTFWRTCVFKYWYTMYFMYKQQQRELLQYIIMYFAYKTVSVVETMYFVNNSILNQRTLQWGNTMRVLVHKQVLTLSWGLNHHYYWTPSYCTYMHAVKKGRRLEKFFELKSRGYRDGIKRKETMGCESLHII